MWQTFKPLVAVALTKKQARKYIEVYAPEDRRAYVARQVAPLIDAHASVSPLFLRFAIEQALAGKLGSTRTLDLVLHYVEALRAGRLDLNADDMLRAASIAATEAVRESLVPGEIEPLQGGAKLSTRPGERRAIQVLIQDSKDSKIQGRIKLENQRLASLNMKDSGTPVRFSGENPPCYEIFGEYYEVFGVLL